MLGARSFSPPASVENDGVDGPNLLRHQAKKSAFNFETKLS
jgi:hypothetical protein